MMRSNTNNKKSHSPVTLSKMSVFTEKESAIAKKSGPSHHEQLLSNAYGSSWSVLNSHLLNLRVIDDPQLKKEVNALKHGLQVFGPNSKQLIDCRDNEGKAKGSVYHGHCKHSSGTVFIMEWSIIDEETKTLAILQFDTHENFNFRQNPLKAHEKTAILKNPSNIALQERIHEKREEAAAKIKRMFS